MHRTATNTRLWFALAFGACALAAALMLLFYINTPRSSPVIAAATATQAPPTIISTPVSTPTPQPNFVFGALGEVQAITIHQSVFAPLGKYTIDSELKPVGDGFQGHAMYCCKYGSDIVTQNIILPYSAATQFLLMLTQAATESPQPQIINYKVAECFTEINITIQLKNYPSSPAYFNASRCEYDNQPWEVHYSGVTFVTHSSTTGRAYKILSPYLHYDDVLVTFLQK